MRVIETSHDAENKLSRELGRDINKKDILERLERTEEIILKQRDEITKLNRELGQLMDFITPKIYQTERMVNQLLRSTIKTRKR